MSTHSGRRRHMEAYMRMYISFYFIYLPLTSFVMLLHARLCAHVHGPQSGCTLIETAYNCYPWTKTEVRLPLFEKFLMVIESKHANDRGDTYNIHNLTPEQLKKREVRAQYQPNMNAYVPKHCS